MRWNYVKYAKYAKYNMSVYKNKNTEKEFDKICDELTI